MILAFFLFSLLLLLLQGSRAQQSGYQYDKHCRVGCSVPWANGTCTPERRTDHCVEALEEPASSFNLSCENFIRFEPNLFLRNLPSGIKWPAVNFTTHLVRFPGDPDEALISPTALSYRIECKEEGGSGDACLLNSKTRNHLEHWPCRAFLFSPPENASKGQESLPATFSYPCIKINTGGDFVLNISLYRNDTRLCRSQFFLRIPKQEHFWESIEKSVEAGDSEAIYRWLPLMMADVSRKKLLIRFTPPPPKVKARLRNEGFFLILEKYDPKTGSMVKTYKAGEGIHKNGVINITSTGFQFLVPKGIYVAKLRPLFSKDNHGLEARLVFQLLENKYGGLEDPEGANHQSHFITILVTVFAVTLAVIAVIGGFSYIYKYFRNRPPVPTPASPPKVLLLYSDDSDSLRRAIEALGSFLKNGIKCDVYLDQWELSGASHVAPDAWHYSAFDSADTVLVLFSHGALAALQGRPLAPRRPWAEMFSPLLQMLLVRIRNQLSRRPVAEMDQPLSSAVWLSLDSDHTLALPVHIGSLPVPHFRLPSQLKDLVGHLYGIDSQRGRLVDELPDSELRAALEDHKEWAHLHPGWLQHRLSSNGVSFIPRPRPMEENGRKRENDEASFPLLPLPPEEEPLRPEEDFPLHPFPDHDDHVQLSQA